MLFAGVAGAEPIGNPALTPAAQHAEPAQTETARPNPGVGENAAADRSASNQQSSSTPPPALTPTSPKLDGPQQYCKALEEAALKNGLPPDFFVRLI